MNHQTSKFDEPIKEGIESIEKNILNSIKDNIRTEMQLLRFEILHSLSSSKEKSKEIIKNVNEVKNIMWKEALKKANGDKKKAYSLYAQISI